MKTSSTLHKVVLGLALLMAVSLNTLPALAQSRCLDPVPNPLAAGWIVEGTGTTQGNSTPLVLVDSSTAAGDVINIRCTPDAAEFNKDIVLTPRLSIDAGFVATSDAIPQTGVHVDINDGTKLIRAVLLAPGGGILRVAVQTVLGTFTTGFYFGGLLADFTLKRRADGAAVLSVPNPLPGLPPLEETTLIDDLPGSPLNRKGVRTLEFGTYDVPAGETSRWTTLGLPSAAPVDVTPVVGTLSGVGSVVNNGPGDQFDPHVSGSLVSYTSSSVIQEIRYYDFGTTVDRGVPGVSGGMDLFSGVSGTTIVFARLITGTSFNAIETFDTATGGPVVELDPQPGTQRFSPKIGDGTVAWSDYGLALGAETVAFDLATRTATRLTNDTALDRNPEVSAGGDVIVWEKCATAATPCDIWQAVKSGGTWAVSQVTSTSDNETQPDTNGSIVIYSSDRAGSNAGADIYWKPVAGGAESRLSLSGTQINPSISGNLIAFESRAQGGSTDDIFLYNLATNTLYQITNTSGLDEQLNDVSVSAGGLVRVVWSVQEADQNVYGFSFRLPASNQPPTANAGANQTIEATSLAGAAVTLTGSGNDPDNDPLTLTWSEGANTLGTGAQISVTLPIGIHTITLTANDGRGGTGTSTVIITVQDTTPPAISITPSQVTVLVNAVPVTRAALGLPSPVVIDIVDPNPRVTDHAPSSFSTGTYAIIFTATDASGNRSQTTLTVNIQLQLTVLNSAVVVTEFQQPNSDVFGATLTIQLGTGNDGINQSADAFHFLATGGSVILPVDLPLSSFRRLLDGSLVFAGPVSGLPTGIALKPLGNGKYVLVLAITKATLSAFKNPVVIEIGLGSDTGRITTNAVILKK